MNNLPNGWQVKSLGEVARFINGKAFKPEDWGTRGLPIIRIQNLTGFSAIYNYYDGAIEPKYLVKKNDLLISWSASLGVYVWNGNDAVLNQHIFKVELGDNIDRVFFYYLIKTKVDEMVSNVHGSTMKHITKDRFDNIQVKLPPLTIQKQIAEILEKADKAKQKRKEANKLTDEFLQSVFIKMFGDPVKNPKGWAVEEFDKLGKLARGKSKHRPRNAPFLLGGKYPLIQTGEIVNSSIHINDYTQTYSEEGLKQSKLWPKGTLCISIAANIGFTAILNFDACFPDSVVGFVANKKVMSEYIHFYFRFIQNQLENYAPQSAQKNINLEILGNLIVPVPPLPLQQQFAEIVKKTEALKEKQKQSEQELENLFQILMQKAFKGELVFS